MSEFLSTSENSVPTSDMGATKDKSAIKYRILALFFFLLAAGGLFIGLLGRYTIAFRHAVMVVGDNLPPLPGSLFCMIYAYCQFLFQGSLSAAFASGKRIGFFAVATCGTYLFVAATVVVALVLCVLSFIPKLKARRCAVVSGTFVAIAYLWLFLHSYFSLVMSTLGVRDYFLALVDLFDFPALIIAGVTIAALTVEAVIHSKAAGVFNFLFFFATCAATCGLLYPDSTPLFLSLCQWATVQPSNDITSIATQVLLVVLALNLLISVCRLSALRGTGVDLLRSVVQFISLIFLFVAYIIRPLGGVGRFTIFTQSPIAVALLIGATLLEILLAIILIALAAGRTRREEAEEESRKYDRAPAPVSAAPVAAAPVVAAAPAPAPIVVQAPPATVERPAAAPVVFYPMPMYQQPMPAPAPAPAPTPAPAPAPAPTPAPAPAPAAEPTDFERKMAAIARGETETAPAPAALLPIAKPARPQPVQQSMYDPQYTYDPFLNGLSPQEKNEFGDLFIGKKRGDFGLPPYVIGGDNKEFFRKVFIYLGRFRSYISEDLLGKIYSYVNET